MHLVLEFFVVLLIAVVKIGLLLGIEFGCMNLVVSVTRHGASNLVKFLESILRDHAQSVLSLLLNSTLLALRGRVSSLADHSVDHSGHSV